VDPINVTEAEQRALEDEVTEAIWAVLLIVRYGWLKEQLANNYLLGTDQYPNTLEIATRILGNYQGTRPSQFGEQKSKGEVLVSIQKGGGSAQGCDTGRGTRNAGQGNTAQGVDAVIWQAQPPQVCPVEPGQTVQERATATIAERKDTGQESA
jgi:hypothetical protein